MTFIQQIRRSVVAATLVIFLSAFTAFGILPGATWAAPSTSVSSSHRQVVMTLPTGREKAAAKMFEGKTEESIGNVTGDPKDQLMGRAKQVQSKVLTATENAKDSLKLN